MPTQSNTHTADEEVSMKWPNVFIGRRAVHSFFGRRMPSMLAALVGDSSIRSIVDLSSMSRRV